MRIRFSSYKEDMTNLCHYFSFFLFFFFFFFWRANNLLQYAFSNQRNQKICVFSLGMVPGWTVLILFLFFFPFFGSEKGSQVPFESPSGGGARVYGLIRQASCWYQWALSFPLLLHQKQCISSIYEFLMNQHRMRKTWIQAQNKKNCRVPNSGSLKVYDKI